MTKLVIVESPNKCKKIQGYLGQGWVVKASLGHVRDLPEKEMGVDLETFRPSYVATTKGKKVLAGLRASVKSAQAVYLAMDPDREGEAIAWHLAEALQLKNAKRITFNEITRQAVQKAVREAGEIDRHRVAAQECRRILDRLVGYSVSPALSDACGCGRWLTAGRVQSVAVRIVAERELAIQNFKPESYVEVFLYFETDGITWRAQWAPGDLLDKNQEHWTDIPFAQRVAALREVNVKAVSQRKQTRRPPPPFITSSLQQAASISLKMAPRKCMQVAQHLFEEGLITYHRTDNPNMSDEGIADVMAWLSDSGYEVTEKPNHWKAKAGAQEGHEAIRPTSIEAIPDGIAGLNDDQRRLYRLIWLRAVASQMKDAVFHVAQADLSSVDSLDGNVMAFVARGRTLLSKGWMALTRGDAAEETRDADDQALPKLEASTRLSAEHGEVVDKQTKAPARFTEASLIKRLESEGIGRPSTYASIIDNILKRHYVAAVKRQLKATELGITIYRAMSERFRFMELAYTRGVEQQLDRIAVGKATYRDVVGSAYAQLASELTAFSGVSIEGVERHACPDCGKPLRLVQGKFWGCSGYPECRYTAPDVDGRPGEQHKPASSMPVDKSHPCVCGKGFMQRRQGKNGYFWGCSNYPECKKTLPDIKGKPGAATVGNEGKDTGLGAGCACPQCGDGSLVGRTITKGRNEGKSFLGCSRFPDCRFFAWAS